MPKNEATFKQTLEMMPLPAFVFDGKAHVFVCVNQQFCDSFGYTEEELKSLPWTTVLADSEQVNAAQQAIDTPQFNVPILFRGRHKDGSEMTLALKYRDMKFVRDDGTVVEVLFGVIIGREGETAKHATEVFGS